MQIKSLRLKNFRNYENITIDFEENYNIIYGDNAQGKTNILEAIFLCASGRSHRTPKDSDLIRVGEKGYYVALEIEKLRNDTAIEISYEQEQKKKVKINEIPVKKIGDLMGHLNAVIFSPEDLQIIKEGPSERRRFLDIALSQIKPSYFYDLQQYLKVLEQRNNLLKGIQKTASLIDTLEVWNQNLIRIGSRIIRVRNEFIRKLSGYAEKNHGNLTGKKEKLTLRYAPSVESENMDEVQEIEKAFEKKLGRLYSQELMKGTTLCGPQRDDYDVLLNDMSVKLYGSQGQQRTAVLALKLSEIDIIKEDAGEYPVLLLDDVMSELDVYRQGFLFENMKDIQTFITCTDREFFMDKVGKGSLFIYVVKGNVSRMEAK